MAADGELRGCRWHDRPLDRGARDDLRADGPARAVRRLPRLVPPLRVGRGRDRSGRARRVPRRARRVARARPVARAARQRFCGAARLEPRPAREHARGRARREARRVPLQPAPPGTAGGARDRGPGQPRPRRGRDPEGEGPAGALALRRSRWVVLGAGTFAQASFSASTVGLPALAPALKSHYRLTLGETGVVLAATGIGMLFTLLPWGLFADRFDERWVIATGLTAAAGSLAIASTTESFAG